MENKLQLITPQYSSFVDDQVLTSHQLNEFIEYFKEQDHLTRICLTGIGVVCGFDLSVFNDDGITIKVTQGCGITSDGDLLKLQQKPDETIKLTDKSTQDTKNILIPEENYKHWKFFEDKDAKYAHFLDGEEVIELRELIPIGEAKEGDESLDDIDLSDKVVILYLENYKEDPSTCTGTDCDNQGQDHVQNVKVLLVTKDDVENVVNNLDEIFNKYDLFEELANLPETAIEKVVLKSGFGNSNIASYAALAEAYHEAITNSKQDLHDAYSDLFASFGDLLEINNGTQNTVLNQIDGMDDYTDRTKVQYRYDLMQDVSDTYNEVLRLLIKIKTECCPNVASFPKHLLLGCLEPEQTDYPEMRHHWYPSPTNTQYNTYMKLAKSLIQRLVLLLDNFSINTEETALEITPSKKGGNLGEKAIPEYYHLDNALLKHWDYFKTENLKHRYNLSYHKDLLATNSWVQHPLKVQLSDHDFYRIEGHFGMEPYTALEEIKSINREFGLDFETLLFDIDLDDKDFKSFIKDHPGISHKAGVPAGGTYILVSENEQVVADFCLSYKAEITEGAGGCCTLRECSYSWISSLKYLNNLARSLKGTQSVNRPMPQNYILNVVEYSINGTKLINTTVQIVIPMWHIFNRRMHAITEALNNRFHDGLVFDYNEADKRFLITCAKDDTFKIRFQESTMKADNPTYTYSPNGMFRNNKVFRQRMMKCREIRAYSPSFYKNLQKELAPVDKDDDYGSYNEKWRKWQEYRDRMVDLPFFRDMPRYITRRNDLPDSIRPTLDDIVRDIREIDSEAELMLDGEWVNGTWLSTEMIDYYNDRPKDTHDTIVLFMKLRASLHNKAIKRETHLSIYITNKTYTTAYDQLIEDYRHDADFYFAPATGGNAISL